MKINEIFYSIQGEGHWAGMPFIFIRVTGCNLRCKFCDTKYAYHGGQLMNIQDIIQKTKKYPCKNVCVTGGEPLLQNGTLQMITKLIDQNYSVCLETNGSQNILNFTKIKPIKKLMISLDIKCPSSDMQDKMYFENIKYLRKHDQLKFVVTNMMDYKYAKKIMEEYNPKSPVCIQPTWGTDPEWLAKAMLKDGLNARLSLQMHKIIFGDKRGV